MDTLELRVRPSYKSFDVLKGRLVRAPHYVSYVGSYWYGEDCIISEWLFSKLNDSRITKAPLSIFNINRLSITAKLETNEVL